MINYFIPRRNAEENVTLMFVTFNFQLPVFNEKKCTFAGEIKSVW